VKNLTFIFLLKSLASGGAASITKFATFLDSDLVNRGQPPVRLEASDMAFTQPKQTETTLWSASLSGQQQSGNNMYNTNMNNQQQSLGSIPSGPTTTTVVESKSSSGNTLLLAMGGTLLLGMLLFLVYNKGKAENKNGQMAASNVQQEVPDVYASKVAQLDSDWTNNDAYGMEQANW